jgi:dihydroxyacid dehydratase/phosphogluconate dehydratase
MSPEQARSRGLTSTVTFPTGNIAPEGSVIKSTAIDRSVIDPDGVYRKTGPARVFASEREAVATLKGRRGEPIRAGDVMVLIGRGPLGAGMEETYQVTSALKYLPYGKHVALLTDARFSGVSTGACIGHVGPEALAGGPAGKLRDGDLIEIEIDTRNLTGRLNFVGRQDQRVSPEEGAELLAARDLNPAVTPDPQLPDDTRVWALLQQAGGGTWGGCVYDAEAIARLMAAGTLALAAAETVPTAAVY